MSSQKVVGTSAADKITVGDDSHDIDALGGNNRITVGNGDNVITSGDGNDQVVLGHGTNTVSISGGSNRITGRNGDTIVTVGDGRDDVRLGHGVNQVSLGAGSNSLTAGNGANTVTSGGGDDKINLGDGANSVDAGSGGNEISAGDGDNAITAGDGKDRIDLGDGSNAVFAGDGANQVSVGDGSNTISTGRHKDTIQAGKGDNVIDAGDGDNRVVVGNGDNDITAGSGRDDIRLGNGSNKVSAGDGDNKISAGHGDNDIVAGASRDDLKLGNGNNAVALGDGDNRFSAGGGNNKIVGGAGKDDVRVRDGDNDIQLSDGLNRIQAGHGNNRITTGKDADSIKLGDGDNVISAGGGKNAISLGNGNNTVNAGDGPNQIKAGHGDNEISTGSGSDRITLGDGGNQVDAGAGHNKVTVGKGTNSIVAGDGNDAIKVKGGTTSIDAGSGKNTISAGHGDATVISGDGDDTIKLGHGAHLITDAGGKNSVTVGHGSADISLGDGDDTIRAGNGTLSVDAGNGTNKITVGKGDIVVETGTGNDAISVKGGSVEIHAGGGKNTISFGGGTSVIRAGDGGNKISVGDGDSTIETGAGVDDIRIGTGRIVLDVGAGNDRIKTGNGDNEIRGGDGADSIQTGKGDDVIHGGTGDDRIRVSDGANRLFGDEGNDTISAGKGNDEIWGGQGDDTIDGGKGHDVARYAGSIDDYEISGSASRLKVTSVKMAVADAGADELSGIEALYFEGSDTLIDVSSPFDGEAVDDSVSSASENPLQIAVSTLLGNDTDLDSGAYNIEVSGRSAKGLKVTFDGSTITFNADDELQYLRKGDVHTDSFTYRLVDLFGNEQEATVNIEINGEYEPPVVQDDLLNEGAGGTGASAYIDSDDVARISIQKLLANDDIEDLEGLEFSLQSLSTEKGARLSYDAAAGKLTYDPSEAEDILALASGETLNDTFTYTITDSHGASDTASVTIVVRGAEPIINEIDAQDDILSGLGDPVEPEITVFEYDAEYRYEPFMMTNGRVVMLHDEGKGITDGTLHVEMYDTDGQAMNNSSVVNQSKLLSIYHGATVHALSNGGFAVSWWSSYGTIEHIDTGAPDPTPGEISMRTMLRLYDADGNPLSDEIMAIEDPENDKDIAISVTELADGRLLVTSESTYDIKHEDRAPPFNHNEVTRAYSTIVAPDGTVETGPFELFDLDPYHSAHVYGSLDPTLKIVALETGGFAAMWLSGDDVHAVVYDENAAIVREPFLVNKPDDFKVWDYPSGFSAGPDGGFAIHWHHVPHNRRESDEKVVVFDANGIPIGDEFSVATPSETSHSGLKNFKLFEYLPNGQLLFLWSDRVDASENKFHLYAQLFETDGTALSQLHLITEYEADSPLWLYGPKLSAQLVDNATIKVTNSYFWNNHEDFENHFDPVHIDQTWTLNIDDMMQPGAWMTSGEIGEITIGELLENDEIDADAFEFSLQTLTSEHGAVLSYDAATGTVTYDPSQSPAIQALKPGEILNDSFTYTLDDGRGVSDTARVTIVVKGAEIEVPSLELTDDVLVSGEMDVTTEGLSEAYEVDGLLGMVKLPNDTYVKYDVTGNDDLTFQIYAPGEQAVSEQIVVNQSMIYAERSGSAVHVLKDGRFAVSWINNYGFIEDPETGELPSFLGRDPVKHMLRLFDIDGNPISDEIEIFDYPFNDESTENSLTQLADGRLLVTTISQHLLEEDEEPIAPWWFGTKALVNTVILNPDGSLNTGSFELFELDRHYYGNQNEIPLTAALDNGGFVSVWLSGEDVRATIHDKNANVVQEPFFINNPEIDAGNNVPVDVSAGPDGGFVVTWRHDRDAEDGYFYRTAVFDADGNAVAGHFDVAAPSLASGFLRMPAMVEYLPEDKILLTWSDPTDMPEDHASLVAQLFEVDGTPLSDKRVVGEYEVSHWRDITQSIEVTDDGTISVTVISRDDWTSPSNVQEKTWTFQLDELMEPGATVTENEVMQIDIQELLENDEIGDEEFEFTLDAVTSENGASLSFDTDTGFVTYDPTAALDIQALNSGEMLTDSFHYTVTDSHGTVDTAKVLLEIAGLDEAAAEAIPDWDI